MNEDIFEGIVDHFQLNKVQKIVITEVWGGRSYAQIAQTYGYDYGYIKDTGYELWRNLSSILGEKVTKHNVRHILKKHIRCTNDRPYETPILGQVVLKGQRLSPIKDCPIPYLEDHETRWIGCQHLIQHLIQKLQSHCRILSLVGITGVGKSALAIRLALDPSIPQSWPTIRVIRFSTENNTFEPFAKQVLGEQYPQASALCSKPKQLIEPLLDYLQSKSCLLILDMVEHILTSDRYGSHLFQDPTFTFFFDQFIQAEDIPSRLILTSQDQIPVMAEGRYRGRSHIEILKGLDSIKSQQLFSIWNIIPSNHHESEYLERIIQTYQGHPLALRIIASEMLEPPYHSNISAYWQDYAQDIIAEELQVQETTGTCQLEQNPIAYYSLSLSDLVKSRIENTLRRLRDSSPLAYILLCMGSVYSCPVERIAWFLLIADSPRSDQITAFQTLQRRFLLESDRTTEQVLYHLHSLIRSVALQHLATLNTDKRASNPNPKSNCNFSQSQ